MKKKFYIDKGENTPKHIAFTDGSAVIHFADGSMILIEYQTPYNNSNLFYQENRNPFIDHPEYVDEIWTVTATEIISKPEIRVYPNPAKDFVNIELGKQDAHGKLYSLSGEKVKEFEEQNRVSVQNLNPGVYVISIATDSKVYNSKLIIQ